MAPTDTAFRTPDIRLHEMHKRHDTGPIIGAEIEREKANKIYDKPDSFKLDYGTVDRPKASKNSVNIPR